MDGFDVQSLVCSVTMLVKTHRKNNPELQTAHNARPLQTLLAPRCLGLRVRSS